MKMDNLDTLIFMHFREVYLFDYLFDLPLWNIHIKSWVVTKPWDNESFDTLRLWKLINCEILAKAYNFLLTRLQILVTWVSTPQWDPPWRGDGSYLSKRFQIIDQQISDGTTFEQDKQILYYTLSRTGFKIEVCSYCSLSYFDYDHSHECLTPEVDHLTMSCGARAMSDNGKWRPYDLQARRKLVKLWLCPLLVSEQKKVAS